MTEELSTNWAAVHSNHGLISITTGSGYRSSFIDLEGDHVVLDEKCTDEELGEALKNALGKSRVILKEDIPKYYGRKITELQYQKWVEKLLLLFGGMSRRKAFTKMKHSFVYVLSGQLKIVPTRKERGEVWGGNGFLDSDTIELSYTSNFKEIGEALRTILTKCK